MVILEGDSSSNLNYRYGVMDVIQIGGDQMGTKMPPIGPEQIARQQPN